MRFPEPLESKVSRSRGCWLWSGARAGQGGYGVLYWRGQKEYAHRLAYQFAGGHLPVGMDVLHTCDTPRCVRPDHLFVGDQAANARDAVRKDRYRRGERNPAAVLTRHQVRRIRRLYRRGLGLSQEELAPMFGVTRSAIAKIVRLRTWARMARPLRFTNGPKPVLTAAQEQQVRRRYAAGGCSLRSLARELDCCQATIHAVLHGRGRW